MAESCFDPKLLSSKKEIKVHSKVKFTYSSMMGRRSTSLDDPNTGMAGRWGAPLS